jgi:hypothetical protein
MLISDMSGSSGGLISEIMFIATLMLAIVLNCFMKEDLKRMNAEKDKKPSIK